MRVLVNYDSTEKKFLTQLAVIGKRYGLDFAATAMDLTPSELMAKAKMGSCSAILLCNEQTLANLVPGKKPTLDLWRGSKLTYEVPVIVCNKLEHINTVEHGEWLLGKDLEKFQSIHLTPPKFGFKALESIEDFAPALKVIDSSILVAYDVETTLLNEPKDEESVEGGDSLITCASWACLTPNGTIEVFVLPLVNLDNTDYWKDAISYGEAIRFLREANASRPFKGMHNGLYDCYHSIRYQAEPHNWVLDSMGLAHSQFSELPKDLAFVASYNLPDYRQWKTESDEAKSSGDQHRYWGYNALDTWYTLRILIQQLRNLPAYARTNYADTFKLVYPSLYCGFEGIKVDNEKRLKLKAEQEAILEQARRNLQVAFANPNFNPGSWQQKQFYLYEILGAKNPKLGKSSSGTDEKNLKAVAEQHPMLALVVEWILDYMGAQKAVGTYFTFRQLNERLLYSIDPFGTETSRMACKASSFWVGTQAQNIPGYAKSMLVADEGYEMAEFDNSQSEARCTAYLSQEEALIAALEDAVKDFYKTLATLFFDIPYEEVTDFFRNKVLKKIVHGTNYMMGAGTFIENIGAKILFEAAHKLGISIVEIPRKNKAYELTLRQFAAMLLDRYHVPFPRVREWYGEIRNEVATTRMLRSPYGTSRYFFGDITKNHKTFRSAVAHAPQHLSVKVLNRGFWRCYKELVLPSKGKFRLKAQVHDSVLSAWPKDERHIWHPRMQECLNNPIVVHGRTLRIPIDSKVGQSWAEKEMEKVKCDMHLKQLAP